jgi:hypothetical protein
LLDREALHRYAQDTRSLACDGCDHHCNPAVAAPVQIGTTLRCLMYHDVYGQPELAKDRFRALPTEARQLAGASRACPHGVDVVSLMDRASKVRV